MLRPGRGTPRDEAEKNEQERLFGGGLMVATVALKGDQALTTVADLVNLSGVSRSAFYRHFADKEECLLTAAEALIEPTLGAIREVPRARPDRGGSDEGRLSRHSSTLIADQPGASKMCFVEVYAAGSGGSSGRREDPRCLRGASSPNCSPKSPGASRCRQQMIRAMIGGLSAPLSTSGSTATKKDRAGGPGALRSGKWWLSYPPPTGELPRPPRRRSQKPRPFEERQSVANPPERVLRALAATVAEKGYPATTVAEVVDRAATSQRTFDEHFANKKEALIAALDSGSAQMLVNDPARFPSRPHWQTRQSTLAYEAMFAFGIEEPEYRPPRAVEMYAAGKGALQTRDTIMEGLEALLAPGYELAPDAPPIAAEAIGGAIYALVYDQVKAKGPESLPELVPMATDMTLAPFIGAEDAYSIATGAAEKGNERPSPPSVPAPVHA